MLALHLERVQATDSLVQSSLRMIVSLTLQ